MAQHDYDIANQPGAAFRADLNAALAAIVGQNSGITAPATTFAGMWWLDTGTSIDSNGPWLRQRNSGNTAWERVIQVDVGLIDALQIQSYTAFTSAGTAPTFTLTPAPALTAYAAGQRFRVKFHATGTTGSNTLNISGRGAKSIKQYDSTGAKVRGIVVTGQLADVEYDGTEMVILNPLQTPQGLQNRIINGDMRIDQRYGGASVTPTVDNTYVIDRFACRLSVASKYSVQQNQGGVTPPAGFTNYLGVTSLSAYTVGASEFFAIEQNIEGLNVTDFGWGTANAQPIAISLRVYSSLTGTFGAVIFNQSGTRSYPFTYTISSANTWTTIVVTIPGDTTGTWLTNNSTGLTVSFALGAGATVSGTAGAWAGSMYRSATGAVNVLGTNGATWKVTGLQLAKGSTDTPFEFLPYGMQLAQCQRYFTKGTDYVRWDGYATAGALFSSYAKFPITMRVIPTLTQINNSSVGFPSTVSNTNLSVDGFYSYRTASATGGGNFIEGYTASAEL